MKKLPSLFFILVCIQSVFSQTENTNLLNKWFYVTDSVQLYEDVSRILSFEEIKSKKFKTPTNYEPNKQAKYWYQLYLKDSLSADSIAFKFMGIDKSEVYFPSLKEGYKKYEVGLLSKTDSKIDWTTQKNIITLPYHSIDWSQPIYFSAAFISTFSIKNLNFSPRMMIYNDAKIIQNSMYISSYQKGEYHFYLGVTVMSFFLFLIGFLVNKNSSFLIYSVYLLTLVAYYVNRTPLALNFWNNFYPELYYYSNQFLRLSHMPIYYYFILRFLDVKKNSPKIAKYIIYSIIVMLGFTFSYLFTIIFFPFFSLRFVMINYYFPVSMLNSLIIFFLLLYKKTDLIAKITLIGSIILMLGGAIAIFSVDALFLLKTVLIETIIFFGVISYQSRLSETAIAQNKLSLEHEKREKTSLLQLNSLKSRFFENISHEFKTPLTLIKAPIEDAIHNKTELTQKDLELLSNNTDRLNRLINDLLSLSKLESGTLSLRLTRENPIAQIKEMAAQYLSYAQSKNIDLQIVLPKKRLSAEYDTDILEKVVANLLSNALKFTNSEGKIILTASIDNEILMLNVEDNGIGISEALKDKIFDRFYQVSEKDESRPGSGIGLSLIKELINLHKGKITMKSTLGEGSIFSVEIPLADIQPDTSIQKTPEDTSKEIISDSLDPSKTAINSDAPLLLIVEDNKELREFLKSRLSYAYRVKLAEDGEKGISKALKYIPDLIISDIMMPNTDGITLCKTLKKNPKTSAIPIVMLTAKATEKDELIGIGIGADAYITKPFNIEILKATLQQLILSRKNLIKRYSGKTLFSPTPENLVTADQDFLERLRKILEQRLVEPGFNIERLSEELGMSRMQLNRRIKEVIGETPTDFLNNEKLELSKILLKDTKLSIKEVAYASGFSSSSYFIKCFRKKFGETPSNYILNT